MGLRDTDVFKRKCINKKKKGFTLVELLISIGIIGILSAIVVVVINPAERLSEFRDVTRINDVKNISKALQVMMALDETFIPCVSDTTGASRFIYSAFGFSTIPSGFVISKMWDATSNPKNIYSGWVEWYSSDMTKTPPLSLWPTDPLNNYKNNRPFMYTLACNNQLRKFEINTTFESNKYMEGGSKDPGATDGGDTNLYEIGNGALDILPATSTFYK